MRPLSTRFLRAIHAQETDEVLLPLVKLSHPTWPDDFRIVPQWEPITHQGEVYQPYSFDIALPDDEPEGIPVLQWSADNLSREMVMLMRAVMDKIDARVVWILASQPDVVEAGPFVVEMRTVEYDAFALSGVMNIEPILEEPFCHMPMTPKTTPGIF